MITEALRALRRVIVEAPETMVLPVHGYLRTEFTTPSRPRAPSYMCARAPRTTA